MSETEQPPQPGWWKASDGNWYPPQGTGAAPPQVVVQKKGGCLKWIGIATLAFVGLLVVIAIAAVAGSKDEDADTGGDGTGVASSSGNTTNPPEADVEITQCADGQFGPEVKIRITNHSSKRSNYLVSLNLENASGTKVGEGTGASNNVEPGQVAEEDVLATASGDVAKCVLKDVERYASN